MTGRGLAAALAVVAAARADGGSRGSNGRATAAPATKSAGTAAERPDLPGHDGPIEPKHGLLGAPGSAPDARRETFTSAGEGSPGESGVTASSKWQSGDRVRSQSSSDVRQARQQQTPDLEFVGGGAAHAKTQDAQGAGKGKR
jgi:hypothetical protein